MGRERGREEKKEEKENKREKEKGEKKNIDRLFLTCAPTGNQTHNLSVYGTMIQPTEPPGQGLSLIHI